MLEPRALSTVACQLWAFLLSPRLEVEEVSITKVKNSSQQCGVNGERGWSGVSRTFVVPQLLDHDETLWCLDSLFGRGED